MGDNQNSGGGLETHHYMNGGFGPPPSSGKDPFCPTSNGGHLTDISGDTHLTLLKSNPGLNSFSSFGEPDGLGSRIPDTFMEMRYIDLGSWDLAGYTAEGLTARLIDNRSLTDSPDNIIQYRPWEKPDSSSPNTIGTNTTTSSPSHMNGNGIMTTSNGKSPTLTTLTSAFPTFSDTFGSLNGQKPLPSFQSQFNSFNEPPVGHHNNHHGSNGDINNHPHPVTTGPPSLPSFHTLPANHRGYVHQGQPTLLPGHGHRDLPNIQPQLLDDRHIQFFPGQLLAAGPPVTNPGMQINGNGQHFVTTNNLCAPPGHHFIGGGPPPSQLVELVSMPPMQLHTHYPHPPAHPHAKLQPQTTDGSIPGLNHNDLHHHTQNNGNVNLNLNGPPSGPGGKYSNDGPVDTVIAVKIPHGNNYDHQQQMNNHSMHPHHMQHQVKMEHQQHTPQSSPQIVTNSTTNGNGLGNHHHNNHHSTPNNTNGPTPKRQQKRKRNIESMDNSGYQHLNNNHQHQNNNSHNNNDLNNDAQVSSVSSSDSDFKRPNLGLNGNGLDDSGLDKPVKKKRKRCGECVGCQKKDNCGDCAPCRNDKSHQICKMRRCEKLTEKKNRIGRGMKQAAAQQQPA